MVKCVSFSVTSVASLFISLINLSVGREIFDCISPNAAACCGPMCLLYSPHTSEICNLASCQMSVQVAVCVSSSMGLSPLFTWEVVKNNSMARFLVGTDSFRRPPPDVKQLSTESHQLRAAFSIPYTAFASFTADPRGMFMTHAI